MEFPLASTSSSSFEQQGPSEHSDDEERNGKKKRRRCVNACTRCKSRKQRCDGAIICGNCAKSGITECVYIEKPSKEDIPREYVEALEARISSLELALAQENPEHPEISDHYKNNSSNGVSPEGSGRRTSSGGISERHSSLMNDLHAILPPEGASVDPKIELEAKLARKEDDLARGVGYLSLNIGSERHFLGNSSGFSWGSIVRSMGVKGSATNVVVPSGSKASSQLNGTAGSSSKTTPPPLNYLNLMPSDTIAHMLITQSYNHLQARYPFMDWIQFKGWHFRRKEMCQPRADDPKREDRVALFFIFMVYAIGCRLSTLSATPSHLPSSELDKYEEYYQAALVQLDFVLEKSDIISIQALLLLINYSFRATNGPSIWQLTGVALRLAIEHGLHRQAPLRLRQKDPLHAEMRKRVFWSVYCIDRLMGDSMGRPLGIEDSYIDEVLPLDINDFETDLATISHLQHSSSTGKGTTSSSPGHAHSAPSPTSMSSAIHSIRLYRLKSRILKTAYHTDSKIKASEVSDILKDLETWHKEVPICSPGIPTCGFDFFERAYYQVSQMLLRPLTERAERGNVFLFACAEAAANACIINQKMHQQSVGASVHSLATLHQVFLAGLTLLHCITRDPTAIPQTKVSRAIRSCSNSLFVYAQLFKSAEPFRDIFEDLCDSMPLNGAAAGASQSTAPVTPATPSLPVMEDGGWSREVEEISGNLHGNVRDDFFSMMNSLGFNASPLPDEVHQPFLLDPSQAASLPPENGEFRDAGVDLSGFSNIFDQPTFSPDPLLRWS